MESERKGRKDGDSERGVVSELSPALWLSPLEFPLLVSLARGGFQVLSWVERF